MLDAANMTRGEETPASRRHLEIYLMLKISISNSRVALGGIVIMLRKSIIHTIHM